MTELENFNIQTFNLSILQQHSNSHQRRQYIDSILTKNLLQELLKEFSVLHIRNDIFQKKNIIVSQKCINDKCKKYNIKIKNLSEAQNCKSVRDKYVKTCIDKYNTINTLAKNAPGYQKRNNTVKNKYGVENVFQLKEVKEKSRQTMFKNHGVVHPVHTLNYRRNNGRKSRPHLKIEQYLKDQNIKFVSEEIGFNMFNIELNKQYNPRVDIKLEQFKLVIEIYGNLYHANPTIYKDSDQIRKFEGLMTAREIREFDQIRQRQIESFGYEVLILWEEDINKRFLKIKKLINAKCKNKKNRKNRKTNKI